MSIVYVRVLSVQVMTDDYFVFVNMSNVITIVFMLTLIYNNLYLCH